MLVFCHFEILLLVSWQPLIFNAINGISVFIFRPLFAVLVLNKTMHVACKHKVAILCTVLEFNV